MARHLGRCGNVFREGGRRPGMPCCGRGPCADLTLRCGICLHASFRWELRPHGPGKHRYGDTREERTNACVLCPNSGLRTGKGRVLRSAVRTRSGRLRPVFPEFGERRSFPGCMPLVRRRTETRRCGLRFWKNRAEALRREVFGDSSEAAVDDRFLGGPKADIIPRLQETAFETSADQGRQSGVRVAASVSAERDPESVCGKTPLSAPSAERSPKKPVTRRRCGPARRW